MRSDKDQFFPLPPPMWNCWTQKKEGVGEDPLPYAAQNQAVLQFLHRWTGGVFREESAAT